MKTEAGESLRRSRICPLWSIYGARNCENDIKVLPLRFLSDGREYTLKYSSNISDVSRDWQGLPSEDLFRQPTFLKVLDSHGPLRIKPQYLLIYQDQKLVLEAVCCLMPFEAKQNIKLTPNHQNLAKRWLEQIRLWMAGKLNFQVLTVGQLVLTGEHSLIWHPDFPQEKIGQVLMDGLDGMVKHLRMNGTPIHGTMIKDMDPDRKEWIHAWKKGDYHPLRFEPNMVLQLWPEWKNFDDYLMALQSKARMRVKRARKKLGNLVCRRLRPDDLQQYGPQMYDMYKSIADGADFNLFSLHPDYFLALCENLPEHFCCKAYFDEDRLVAFYTAFDNGEELEAHFLGLDQEANREHQLYLNILLDLLEMGIKVGAKQVVYARTAPEIKSSIGAEPHALDLYLRASNPIINWALPTFVDWLAPRTEWQARHPFKTAS